MMKGRDLLRCGEVGRGEYIHDLVKVLRIGVFCVDDASFAVY